MSLMRLTVFYKGSRHIYIYIISTNFCILLLVLLYTLSFLLVVLFLNLTVVASIYETMENFEVCSTFEIMINLVSAQECDDELV